MRFDIQHLLSNNELSSDLTRLVSAADSCMAELAQINLDHHLLQQQMQVTRHLISQYRASDFSEATIQSLVARADKLMAHIDRLEKRYQMAKGKETLIMS